MVMWLIVPGLTIVPMLRGGMPFRTLCVLLMTRSVMKCVPTLEWCDPRRLDHAVPDALRPLDDAERHEMRSHAGVV
ncbi:hypothetical protein AO256_09770 [Pseudomonas syringae]|nr:hypothetical protein AO256_09770 [Pseudomonas syringae]